MLRVLFILFLLALYSDRFGKRRRKSLFFFPWSLMSLFRIWPYTYHWNSGMGHSPDMFGGFGGFGSFGSFGGPGGFGGGHSRGGGAGRHF